MDEILEFRLLLRLHRSHPGILTHTGGARATHPDTLQATTGLRDPAQPWKIYFRTRRNCHCKID